MKITQHSERLWDDGNKYKVLIVKTGDKKGSYSHYRGYEWEYDPNEATSHGLMTFEYNDEEEK